MPFEFQDGPASSGQDISVQCMTTEGDLPLEISWYLNNKSVVEYAGISTVKAGKRNLVLNIESVTADHSGNFTCIAQNKAGSVSYTTDLKVNGIGSFIGISLIISFITYNPTPLLINQNISCLISSSQNRSLLLRGRTCQFGSGYFCNLRGS